MFIAIMASAGAGFAGIYDSKYISKAMVGWIALLPGFIVLFATTMKFDGRARWHYKKKREIEALLGRLKFEMPSTPSEDQIAIIHRAKAEIDKRPDEEFDKEFILNWKWAGGGQNSGNA
jgi:hypothetical protein